VVEEMNNLKLWFERNNTILLGVTSTLVLFIVLIVILNYAVMPLYTKQGAEVDLVDVTEMPYDKAEKMLKSQGFKMVHDTTTFNATYPESTVIAQNPLPYTKVKRGRRIYVTLSGGERIVKVPHVIGTSERDAIFTLRGAGLTIGNTYYEYSNYYPEGTVSKQSISAGIDTTNKSIVDISVSLGRIPSEFIVPNVVGKSFDTAKTLLWKSGLEVGSVTYQLHEKLIPYTVISQAVEPGSKVKQGKPIDLVVSLMEEKS
jgi:beta-lactam-binding protein with PASTA domain